MAFTERKTQFHMRCPTCGRLSRLSPGATLPKNFAVDHDLKIRVQTFPGGGRGGPGNGFAWDVQSMSREAAIALQRLCLAIAKRLERVSKGESDGEAD